MSDRMAVFNQRPDRAGRQPGRGLRAARDAVRRRLRRHLEPAHAARPRRTILGQDGTFTVRPEKIRIGGPMPTPGADETSAARDASRRSSISGPDTRYIVDLDAGGQLVVVAAEPGHVVDRGARARGQEVRLTWKRLHNLALAGERHAGAMASSGNGRRVAYAHGDSGGVPGRGRGHGRQRMAHSSRQRTSAAGTAASTAGAARSRRHRDACRRHRRAPRGRPPANARTAGVPTCDRRRRGPADGPGLAGLRRERQHRPDSRLGHTVRGRRPAARSTSQIFGTSDEAFSIFTTNPDQVRRHLRFGRREPAPRPRRLRPARQRRPDRQLRGHLPVAQGPAVQHGRRRPLRRAPRPRREPADVAHRHRSTPAPTTLGPDVRPPTPRYKVSVYDAPIYIADAAVVLMDDEAGARASRTRTPSTTPSSRRRSPC